MEANNWFKRFIKRLFLRIYLLFYKKINNKFGIQDEIEYQRVSLSICRKLINQDDSVFLTAPISGKKYIKNDRLGIFVVMMERHINITNHVYNYSVFVSERDWERLTYVYDQVSEKRRLEYEESIKSQITHSLHSILDKITNS